MKKKNYYLTVITVIFLLFGGVLMFSLSTPENTFTLAGIGLLTSAGIICCLLLAETMTAGQPVSRQGLAYQSILVVDSISADEESAILKQENGVDLYVRGPKGFIPQNAQRGTTLRVGKNNEGRNKFIILNG